MDDPRADRLRCMSMPSKQGAAKIDPIVKRQLEQEMQELQEQLEQDKDQLLALVEEQQQKLVAMKVKTMEAEREKQRIAAELSLLKVRLPSGPRLNHSGC